MWLKKVCAEEIICRREEGKEVDFGSRYLELWEPVSATRVELFHNVSLSGPQSC